MPNRADQKPHITHGVTEIYVTHVRKNKAAIFRVWLKKLHQLESTFPGFQKIHVQAPQNKKEGSWITFLQFDTEEHLENWLHSPERQAMLDRSDEFVVSQESHRVLSSFDSWFASHDLLHAPPVWKQTMLVLLALFPAVMMEAKFLSPFLLSTLHPVLSIFINLAITVCLISWPLMPFMIYVLRWWLNATSKTLEYLGTLTVFILYLVEIGFFIMVG